MQGAIQNLQKQKSELEHSVMELQRKQDAYERNNEMNKNYRINNTPHFSYQVILEWDQATIVTKKKRFANPTDYASDRHLGYQEVQTNLIRSWWVLSAIFLISPATTSRHDRRSHVSGGFSGEGK